MKTKVNRLNAFLTVMAVITFLGTIFITSSVAAKEVENKTITGMVIELGLDAEGNPTAAVIQTELEDFLIVKDAKGNELMKMIDKTVEVTGAVREAVDISEITVHSYKVIDTE